MLADEPTDNLDSQSGAEVIALMRKLNRELGVTFIIVTHDHAAARQTHRVLVMQDGRIVADHQVGDPLEEDLKAFCDLELGRALLAGGAAIPEWLPSEEAQLPRRVLQR